MKTTTYNRRQLLKTLFCSSAALSLNINRHRAATNDFKANALNLLAWGDYGSQSKEQTLVAQALQKFTLNHQFTPQAQLLLGDNFYNEVQGWIDGPRWQTGFEQMYPATSFPNTCYAILGNHDYHNTDRGDQMQLAYAKRGNTRYTMPNQWYRFDLTHQNQSFTFLMLDTNIPEVSGGMDKVEKKERNHLNAELTEQQLQWFKEQLQSQRGDFTIVCGHHPLYSNGAHGDIPPLIQMFEDLFQQHGVHIYLCGHDHDMQHLEFQDKKTSFVISGGGGAKLRDLKIQRPNTYSNKIHGFTHLQLHEDGINIHHHDPDLNLIHGFTKKKDFSIKIL
jgi:hypothetical protein